MDSVFISSVQRDFERERQAARSAVESLGLRAIMAETVAASPALPRDALLGHVEAADAMILILGSRYGETGTSGFSPTEDEFNRAVESGKDVLVFIQQDVDRDAEQEQFVTRVRGRWEQGYYAPGFRTPEELGFAVVRALRELAEQRVGSDAAPEAQARAQQLALGEQRRDRMGGAATVRIAFVPVGTPLLLDAVVLEDRELPERVGDAVRANRLIPHSAALDVRVGSDGLHLSAQDRATSTATAIAIGSRGEVMVESDCRAEGMLGGSAIADDRVHALIGSASNSSQDFWSLIDAGGRIRQIATAIGVPDANMTVYALAPVGNRMSMPIANPPAIVVPDPALLVRRNDVGRDETTQRLLAELRRAFTDAGAVHR